MAAAAENSFVNNKWIFGQVVAVVVFLPVVAECFHSWSREKMRKRKTEHSGNVGSRYCFISTVE